MDSMLKRRDFIRQAGMAGMAAMVPGQILSTPLAPLYDCPIDPGKEFALLKLEKILPGYDFRPDNAHSTGNYELDFTLYNLYRNLAKPAGSFRISRHADQAPNFRVESIRNCSSDIHLRTGDLVKHFVGAYYFTGEIFAEDNILATPRSWLCHTKIARTQKAAAYMDTAHTWRGRYGNGEISYESGPYTYSKAAGSRELTWKWGIIHLVQKMAELSMDEIHFSALDEMDMVYDHQYARFRKKQAVDCGGAVLDFKVYDVLGDGIIPTVYWIDNRHRVVFIVTGTEAYVLD
jgi:hypothetical protein